MRNVRGAGYAPRLGGRAIPVPTSDEGITLSKSTPVYAPWLGDRAIPVPTSDEGITRTNPPVYLAARTTAQTSNEAPYHLGEITRQEKTLTPHVGRNGTLGGRKISQGLRDPHPDFHPRRSRQRETI